MCGPVAGLIQGGLGAMSGLAGYNAKVEDFNAQEAAWKTNYVAALAAGRDNEQQLTDKAEEEQAATTQKLGEYDVEGAQKAALAETSAAGAGVGGNSVDAVIHGILSGAAQNRYYTQVNAASKAQEIADEQRGTVSQEEDRINSVQRPTAPSPLEGLLGVAGPLVSAAGPMVNM